tara:strand:+ start:642 stop:1043 length:402 start_codon:yes stop_codon:yes gene_type:complete
MNSYHEEIFKKIIKKDMNLYFKDYDGTKVNLSELIDEFIASKHTIFEEEKKEYKECKTHIFRDRIKYLNRENKCLARIWNCGMGGQCSFTGKYDGFCKPHSEKGGYEWWLGTVDTQRPERPINHKEKVHIWLK